MNHELNLWLAEHLLLDTLTCARSAAHMGTVDDPYPPVPATLIRYNAAWCSEECARRAGDYTLDEGQLFRDDQFHEGGGLLPDLSNSGDGMLLVLEALTDSGYCPILVFDDDGNWGLALSSMTAPIGVVVPEDDETQWCESAPMAVALAAKAALERNMP